MNVAFIGLGTMGYLMAGHLQTTGMNVTVYNRNTSRARQWQREYLGHWAPTARQACLDAQVVMICVGNDDDVRSVCYGEEGILAGLSAGTVVVDHTTTSSEVAQELAQASKNKGSVFVDAPVSGGEIGAQNGELTIMIGGDTSAVCEVTPLLGAYGKQINHLGDTGAGQTCKMVNQLCIAGILQGMSEGLTLAQRSGLDLLQVKDVLKHGAAQSWQLEQRTGTIANNEYEFGFAIDWMRKDLGICLDRAKDLGLFLPLAELVDDAYRQLQEQGCNRCDTSILIKATQQQLLTPDS